MRSLLRFIAGYMAALTLLAAVLAFIKPASFLPFGAIYKELFAATMFALGVVLNRDDLISTLKEPLRIALGVLTQFVVMPLLAYSLVVITGLPPPLALGFIIVGSAPGAMASNVIVYLAGGALAYSISLTTLATFLAPVMTPLLVSWLGGEFIAIDPLSMMWTITYILVIPLSGGMLFRYYLDKSASWRFMLAHLFVAAGLLLLLARLSPLHGGQWLLAGCFLIALPATARLIPRHLAGGVLNWSREFAPALAAVAIVVICAFAVAKNQAQIHQTGALVFALVIVLNALGYLCGWYLARLYRFDQTHRITLAIEIGMQNAGMGVALALDQFADQPSVALPGALFAVWCILTAAGASTYFRRRQALVNA